MTEEAKAARRDYYREWRKKNPDKVKATLERYWSRRFAAMSNQEQPETRSADPEKQTSRFNG